MAWKWEVAVVVVVVERSVETDDMIDSQHSHPEIEQTAHRRRVISPLRLVDGSLVVASGGLGFQRSLRPVRLCSMAILMFPKPSFEGRLEVGLRIPFEAVNGCISLTRSTWRGAHRIFRTKLEDWCTMMGVV